MERRRVADWPRLGEPERRRVILREQEALAGLADPVPAPEDALADPAAREHVRRIRQRVRDANRGFHRSSTPETP